MLLFKGLRIFYDLDGSSSSASSTEAVATTEEVKEQTTEGKDNVGGQPEIGQARNNAWMAQLPKDLQQNEQLKGFSSIGDLAKAYLGKGQEVKEDKRSFLEKVTVEPNKEEWDGFRKELLSENATEDEKKGLESYIDFAKKININSTQAKELLKVSKELATSQNAKRQEYEEQAPKRCEEFLKKHWGDSYDSELSQAKKGYAKLFSADGDELAKSFMQSKYTNDPLIMQLLSRVGSLLAEPKGAFENKTEHAKVENGWGIAEKFYK